MLQHVSIIIQIIFRKLVGSLLKVTEFKSFYRFFKIVKVICGDAAVGYWLNAILLLVSGLSIFRPDLGANFEFDLKRIIALSNFKECHPRCACETYIC